MKFGSNQSLFSLIIVFTICIGYCHSFRCHQCNSFDDEHCEVLQKNSTHLKECNDTTTNSVQDGQSLSFNNKSDEDILHLLLEPQLRTLSHNNDLGNSTKNFTICRKMVIRVFETYHSKDGDVSRYKSMEKDRIVRQCGYISDPKHDTTCVSRRSPSLRQLTCSCNDREGCNGGNSFKFISSASSIKYLVTLIILYKLSIILIQ